MSEFHRRQVSKNTLTVNSPLTINLPRNYPIRKLVCKLAGSYTVVGTGTAGALRDGSALNLIRSVEVRRNGQDSLIKIEPSVLHRINQLFYGTRPAIVEPANNTVQADTPVSGSFVIPFEVMKGYREIDTLLKSGGLSGLDLIVDVGQAADIQVGGANAYSVGATPFSLIVDAEEELGLDSWVFGDMKLYNISRVTVPATSHAFQVKPIPVGNEWYAFILVAKEAGVLSNAIINTIKLSSGSEVFVGDIDAGNLRDDNKREFKLETMPTGYHVLMANKDGMLNSLWDTRLGTGRNTLEFTLDVTAGAASEISVYGLEYIRPANVPAKKT